MASMTAKATRIGADATRSPPLSDRDHLVRVTTRTAARATLLRSRLPLRANLKST
jgi:hypothetical protein